MKARVEVFSVSEVPETQTESDGAIIPPRIKTALGAGDSGGNGEIPPVVRRAFGSGDWQKNPTDEELDCALFLALGERADLEWNDPTVDPWLLRDMDRLGLFELATAEPVEPVSEKKVQQFLKECKRAGLVKRQKDLNLRQYIGALSILNPFKR